MKNFRALAAVPAFALACCVPPAPEPTPPPVAAPAPAPTPVPPPVVTQQTFDNWMDAPATPGDWSYTPGRGTGGQALFGNGRVSMTCNRANGTITLSRSGSVARPVPMRIRTESTDRTLTGNPGQNGSVMVSLPARDSIWEAMAFSKGRFAIETQGLPTLYIPAWPEVTRVIEDCR